MPDTPTDYPIVDLHTHMWRSVQAGQRAFWRNPHTAVIPYTGTAEDHLAGMADAGVAYSAGIVVTVTRELRQKALRERGDYGSAVWESNSGLTLDAKLLRRMDYENAWCCWVGQQHPSIVPFIMVDPRLLAGDALAAYVQNRWEEGARGVKLLSVQTHHHGDDRRLFPMYEFMQSINMPIFAQSGGGLGMAQNGLAVNPVTGDAWGRPGRFAEVLETFPRLNIVLAHALGGYNGTMGDALALADRYEHVYFDTTVVTPRVLERPELAMDLARLIRRVGAEHCVFGSNFPLTEFDHDRRKYIQVILDLPLLTDAEKRRILSDNGMAIVHGSQPIGVEAPGGDSAH